MSSAMIKTMFRLFVMRAEGNVNKKYKEVESAIEGPISKTCFGRVHIDTLYSIKLIRQNMDARLAIIPDTIQKTLVTNALMGPLSNQQARLK